VYNESVNSEGKTCLLTASRCFSFVYNHKRSLYSLPLSPIYGPSRHAEQDALLCSFHHGSSPITPWHFLRPTAHPTRPFPSVPILSF